MIGLLRKEYYLLENQMKSWLIVAAFLFIYACIMNGNSFLYMLTALIGIMSSMTVFSLDNACGWDTYANSLPLTRKDIVKARYLSVFLIDAGVTIGCGALVFLRYLFIQEGSLADSMHSLFQILLVTVLMQLLVLPVIYKVGVEKARVVYMAVFLCLSIALIGFSRLEDKGAVLDGLRLTLENIVSIGEWGVLLLDAAGWFLSLKLSVRIYEKHEF